MVLSFVLVGFQIIGFLVIYLLVKRKILRSVGPDAVLEKIRSELNSLMVEINSSTDRNVRLITERIEQLQELLTKADRKIAILQRETEKHDMSKAVYSRLVARGPKIGPKVARDSSVQDEVIKLHREGFSPDVIAGHVGTTVGEVELIISLAEDRG